MTEALDVITRIRRLADKLARDPDDDDVRLLGEYLRETGGRGSLPEYLGLENARGHSAWREAAYRARDEAFREAAMSLGDGLTLPERARVLSRQLGRYRAGQWHRFDRHKPECPHPAGSLRALLWKALKAVDRDLGERQMARIILE